MKRFMLTVALTCVLSVSALAGEMPTVPVATTTPAPATTTAPGEMPTVPGPLPATGQTQGAGILATIILTIISLPR